jgi:hypothetical protein
VHNEAWVSTIRTAEKGQAKNVFFISEPHKALSIALSGARTVCAQW